MTSPNELNEDEDPIRRLPERSNNAEPFDLEAFLNSPNPKVFDPQKVVRASEPFDVDEFINFIRATRNNSPE